MHTKKLTFIALGLFTLLGISSFTAFDKQDEPKPKNLKILPKNISAAELEATMKGFNMALGVKCNHCHAPKTDGERGLDFASDANPQKDVARKMMKMTAKINKKYFKHHHQDGSLVQIDCGTCHNGQAQPQVRLVAKD